MTSRSQRLADQASALAAAFLALAEARSQLGAAAPAIDLAGTRVAVRRFCEAARAAGVRPHAIRRFVGTLMERALADDVPTAIRRQAVLDAERTVDHAFIVQPLH